MKTFEEFEAALLNGESVYVTNDRGVLFCFYPGRKSDVCGLITVCVEISVIFSETYKDNILSATVVTSIEAYWIYEKFSKLA